MVKKSVAIIGEGETEWFYFDRLRIHKRYSFRLRPSFPKHSSWQSLFQDAERCKAEGYDKVIVLIDMDVIYNTPQQDKYQKEKKRIQKKGIRVIETNPCIEFWFLLHFLQTLSTKCYENYEAVVKDLRRYLPDYEKSKQYLNKEKLYRALFDNEKLSRATDHADQLLKLAQETPEALHSYTEIHEVLKLLDSLEKQSS